MANSDKNIVIQPSIGSTVDQPSITFTGAGNSSITLKVLDDAEGTLSFEGYEGQVFAINNNLSSGVIYSVNDISGFPIIDADASGNVRLSVYSGNVGVGTTLATQKLDVNGTVKATAFSGDGSALTNVTAGTATTATNITLADESSDTTCFPIFATDATGNQAPKTDSSALTYNASTGALGATRLTAGTGGFTVSAASTFTGRINQSTNRNSVIIGDTVTGSGSFAKNAGGENGYNIIFGVGSGVTMVTNASGTPGFNNIIGYESLRSSQSNASGTPGFNNVLGYQVMYNGASTGGGDHAGYNNFIGYRVAYTSTVAHGGGYNNAVGYEALYNIGNGRGNNAFGWSALYGTTSGDYNIGIGFTAGGDITSGHRNIAIGYDAQVPSATGSDQLAIGSNGSYWVLGDSSYNVGIGTNAIDTAAKLTVGGGVTATTYYGDGSNLTGISAGTPEVDTTVSTTSATGVGSFATATYRSADVIAQITQGSSYQVGRYLMIHDGTTVTVVEESSVATGSMLGSFDGAINGSNAELRVTLVSAGTAATVTTKIDTVTI